MIPLRWIFRSRWAALAWGAGICLSAVRFAGHETVAVDAANASDTAAATRAALNAEDPE